jgi:hypothetical protein
MAEVACTDEFLGVDLQHMGRKPAAPAGRARKATVGAKATKGRVRIGDAWNAITIIALSQNNPYKAIAEFVENSIDAHARTITIVQGKERGELYRSSTTATACRAPRTARRTSGTWPRTSATRSNALPAAGQPGRKGGLPAPGGGAAPPRLFLGRRRPL